MYTIRQVKPATSLSNPRVSVVAYYLPKARSASITFHLNLPVRQFHCCHKTDHGIRRTVYPKAKTFFGCSEYAVDLECFSARG